MRKPVDAGGAGLHLRLRPVDAGLVIGEQAGELAAGGAPVLPELVGGDAHDHRAHPEVEPAGGAQHAHAGVDERPAGAALGPGGEARFVECRAGFHRPDERGAIDLRLALQLLDEVAVPVQTADERGEGSRARPGARTGCRGWPGEPRRPAGSRGSRRCPRRDAATGASSGPHRRRGSTSPCGRGGRASRKLRRVVSPALRPPRCRSGHGSDIRPSVFEGGSDPHINSRHRHQPQWCRHQWPAHLLVPLARPAVATREAADHAGLAPLVPGDAVRSRPGTDAAVAAAGGHKLRIAWLDLRPRPPRPCLGRHARHPLARAAPDRRDPPPRASRRLGAPMGPADAPATGAGTSAADGGTWKSTSGRSRPQTHWA